MNKILLLIKNCFIKQNIIKPPLFYTEEFVIKLLMQFAVESHK